jgi:KaiC/GvpD/RAD55 family RecA-like ATPase
MLSLQEFASKLERVKWRGADAFTALCPGHEDRQASLSVSHGPRGLLLKCFTGCEAESIIRAMGLKWSDVCADREQPARPAQGRETAWTIRNADGCAMAEHVRIDEPGGKRFIWRRDGQNTLGGLSAADLLYRAETVASSTGPVFICEGEKAADAVVRLGHAAVATVCGASATPTLTALAPLAGRDVVLWPDNDAPGRKHMEGIEARLRELAPPAASIRWVEVPGAALKADAANYTGKAADLERCIKSEGGPITMFREHIDSAYRELIRVADGDRSRTVTTGLEQLDQHLGGGLRRGQVTLLGAPSGAGKTSLVVQFAMAAQAEGTALVVSPEMSPEELVTREIVRRSGFPKWQVAPWVRDMKLREDALAAHARATQELRSSPPRVALFDAVTITLDEVVESARQLAKREGRLSLIALDYAQQLADESPDTPRYRAVGAVGLRAIELAREFDCAVLVTSQVNVYRDGKDKNYSIRESANLEQKANNVLLFLVERNQDGSVEKAVFRATKMRDGALFTMDVDWQPQCFRLGDKRNEVVRDFRDWANG